MATALGGRCPEGGGMDKVTSKVLEIVRDMGDMGTDASTSPDE